jgi:hypothetical protein
MAYSWDTNSDVSFAGAQSMRTMVTITQNGPHTFYVKAWNTKGALCLDTLSITVGGGIAVSAPALSSNLTSPFTLEAQAPSCGGESTASMAYEMNTGQVYIYNGATSLNTSVIASQGPGQILRVKAWGSSGNYCETDINLAVSATAGLSPNPGASHYDHLENDKNYTGTYANCGGANGPGSYTNLWQTQPDCGTPGTNAGSTTPVTAPIYGSDSSSREYTMSYTASGGGVRWFDAKTADDAATHFQYDIYAYFPNVSKVMNIEMDMNHATTSPLKTVYILAAQCNLSLGVWQVTANRVWVNTNAPCTTSQITPGVWHHFQIQTHHEASGGTGIYYDAVAVDGNATNITSCTNPTTGAAVSCDSTSESLGWGGVIGPNFQIDGIGSGGNITAYADNFTVYFWQ